MIALLLRLALDPVLASHVGAALAGTPELGECLSRIAWRESRHELVGVHESDAWMQRRLGEGMSTRGVHGLVAAYSLPYAPLPLPAWALDVPLVSAYVATRRSTSRRCSWVAACVRWRQCR